MEIHTGYFRKAGYWWLTKRFYFLIFAVGRWKKEGKRDSGLVPGSGVLLWANMRFVPAKRNLPGERGGLVFALFTQKYKLGRT